MECLRDYIGVLGCGATAPAGTKYINSLPGISLESIESLADSEQRNYLGVWNDVQTRALAKFDIDVNEKFAKRFRIKQIRSSVDLLRIINTASVTPAASEKRGFSIELTVKNSMFVSSNLQSIFLESLSVYIIDKTVIGPSIAITAVNLDTQQILDTFTVLVANLSNGWNNVQVNKSYSADRIAFIYDAAEIDSVNQKIALYASNGLSQLVSVVYGGYCSPYLRGIHYTDLGAPSFGIDSFGLTGVFSVVCKWDNLVCNNKEQFVYPIWYLHGAEMMIERINTDRVNYWTTVGREKARALYADFMSEYDRSLSQLVDSISIADNDACVECNEKLQWVETQM